MVEYLMPLGHEEIESKIAKLALLNELIAKCHAEIKGPLTIVCSELESFQSDEGNITAERLKVTHRAALHIANLLAEIHSVAEQNSEVAKPASAPGKMLKLIE